MRTLRRLDPWTTFNVARLKRKLTANAEVGVLASAVNRFETPMPVSSTCALAPSPRGRCTNDAYVISTDGRWRSAAGDYAAVWQAVGTTLRNGPPRYSPDGKDILPGRWAPGGSLYVGKEGGAHWLWSSWQHLSGQMLEFNDVGYLERKNDWQSYWALRYRTLAATRFTAETTTSLSFNFRTTLDGVNLWNEVVLGTYVHRCAASGRSTSTRTRAAPTSTIARPATARRCSGRPASAPPRRSEPIRGAR